MQDKNENGMTHTGDTTAGALAEALGGAARAHSHGTVVQCPAHEDRHPSLRIGETGGRGKAMTLQVRCLAGCKSTDVLPHLKATGLWG